MALRFHTGNGRFECTQNLIYLPATLKYSSTATQPHVECLAVLRFGFMVYHQEHTIPFLLYTLAYHQVYNTLIPRPIPSFSMLHAESGMAWYAK